MRPLLFFVILFLLAPTTVLAHPETGYLPDAIAEVEYKIVLEINPRDIATRNKLGIVLYRKNKLQEAENQFMTILKIAPADFDAHDGMGLVRLKQGKYKDALAWFQKAVALSASDTMVRYNLGVAYEQLGFLREAREAYQKALAVNEENFRRNVNRDLEAGKRAQIESALQGVTAKQKHSGADRR